MFHKAPVFLSAYSSCYPSVGLSHEVSFYLAPFFLSIAQHLSLSLAAVLLFPCLSCSHLPISACLHPSAIPPSPSSLLALASVPPSLWQSGKHPVPPCPCLSLSPPPPFLCLCSSFYACLHGTVPTAQGLLTLGLRSEERRVGKECRSRWSAYH